MDRWVLGLDLVKVDQATAVNAMLDAWEEAQEHAEKAWQEPKTWYQWAISRWGDATGRQTALALVRILGIQYNDELTKSDIKRLDDLLARMRAGESIAKLKREAKRAASQSPF